MNFRNDRVVQVSFLGLGAVSNKSSNFKDINKEDVRQTLRNIKGKKTTELDEIVEEILLEGEGVLVECLRVFN